MRFYLSLSGDAVRTGEMRRQQLSGSVQGGGRLVQYRVVGLENVWHARGDVERNLDVDVVVGGPARPARRIASSRGTS